MRFTCSVKPRSTVVGQSMCQCYNCWSVKSLLVAAFKVDLHKCNSQNQIIHTSFGCSEPNNFTAVRSPAVMYLHLPNNLTNVIPIYMQGGETGYQTCPTVLGSAVRLWKTTSPFPATMPQPLSAQTAAVQTAAAVQAAAAVQKAAEPAAAEVQTAAVQAAAALPE